VLLIGSAQTKIIYYRSATTERENRYKLLSNVGKSVPGQMACLSDPEKFPQPRRCGVQVPPMCRWSPSADGRSEHGRVCIGTGTRRTSPPGQE